MPVAELTPTQYLTLLMIERERAGAPLQERDMERLMHPRPCAEALVYLKAYGAIAPRQNLGGVAIAGTLVPTKDGQIALCGQIMSVEGKLNEIVTGLRMKREKFEAVKGGASSAKEYERQAQLWEGLRAQIDQVRAVVFQTMPMDAGMRQAVEIGLRQLEEARAASAAQPVTSTTVAAPAIVSTPTPVAKPKNKGGRPRKHPLPPVAPTESEPAAQR